MKKNLPEQAPTKTQLSYLHCRLLINYVRGHIDDRLCSSKSSLPFSLPLRHSRDKLSQALSCFSILKATESWAVPGNEAIIEVLLRPWMEGNPNGTVVSGPLSVSRDMRHWIYFITLCQAYICGIHYSVERNATLPSIIPWNGVRSYRLACKQYRLVLLMTCSSCWSW